MAGKKTDDKGARPIKHQNRRVFAFMHKQGGQGANGNTRGSNKNVRGVLPVG